MNELDTSLEDLKIFNDTSGKYASPWTEIDRQICENRSAIDDALTDRDLAAFISYSGRCGFANAGRHAYVVNRRNNKQVNATVRVTWKHGLQTGSSDISKMLEPGMRIQLGCTQSTSGETLSYSVVGAEVM